MDCQSIGRRAALAGLLFTAAVRAEIALEAVITSGLNGPVYVTSPPGDDRLFVVEQGGSIKVFENDGTTLGTFLTLSGISSGGERGLLGLAFHRDYASNGFFFVNYTDTIGGQLTTVIERYTVSGNPDRASTAAADIKTILEIDQPAFNHNAGWLGFSPLDGYLYIPLGDGGGSGGYDPFNNGQNIDTLLGSILRIDVDVDPAPYAIPGDNPFVDKPGRDEIWARGTRNPYRAGFDRITGEFYFGDVGQGAWEEVNEGVREANYGWPLREGFAPAPVGGGDLAPRRDPLYVYANGPGPRSVTGGPVYRGPVLELQGRLIFADFYTGQIWATAPDGSDADGDGRIDTSTAFEIQNDLGFTSGNPVAFGEDDDGDMYIVDRDGRVLRITGTVASPAEVGALPFAALIALAMVLLLASAAVSRR
ncbi:MAG: glucose dehydrogenase [Gammaproteobacteria bacterium]|nr:glucose dehydrogenase [Gammaproteobacteria bacterium]